MNCKVLMIAILMTFTPLAGCLGGEEVDFVEEYIGESLVIFVFNGTDANGALTDNGSDHLFDATFETNPTSSENITLSNLTIKIIVDGGVPIQCSHNNQSTSCTFNDGNGDSVWSQNEVLTIKENQDDICSSAGCDVDVEFFIRGSDGGDKYAGEFELQLT